VGVQSISSGSSSGREGGTAVVDKDGRPNTGLGGVMMGLEDKLRVVRSGSATVCVEIPGVVARL